MIAFLCMILLLIISKDAPRTPLPTDTENTTDDTPSSNQIAMIELSQEGIPTGCESVSTVAVLQYFDVDISCDTFINQFLPQKGFYKMDGKIYGANPHEYFAGDPYKTASLGCYPKVIMTALEATKNSDYPKTDCLHFQNTTGSDLDTLIKKYIDRQIPVILWVTIDMKQPYEGMKYFLEDGTTYTWTAQEHCTVLCGYDQDSYFLMDPLKEGNITAYPKSLVEKRYNEMGKYSLAISFL